MHIRRTPQAAQNVISNTQDCEAICIETIQYCLEVGGSHATPSHARLLQDCADICETTKKVQLRGTHEPLTAACSTPSASRASPLDQESVCPGMGVPPSHCPPVLFHSDEP